MRWQPFLSSATSARITRVASQKQVCGPSNISINVCLHEHHLRHILQHLDPCIYTIIANVHEEGYQTWYISMQIYSGDHWFHPFWSNWLFSFVVVTTLLQEEFINTMETIVTKKQSFKVKKEEGWYSEEEMRNDLGWNQCHALFCIYLIVLRTPSIWRMVLSQTRMHLPTDVVIYEFMHNLCRTNLQQLGPESTGQRRDASRSQTAMSGFAVPTCSALHIYSKLLHATIHELKDFGTVFCMHWYSKYVSCAIYRTCSNQT